MKLFLVKIVLFYSLVSLVFPSVPLSFAQGPDTLWTKIYGAEDSKGHSVQQTADGGFIIAGETSLRNYQIYLVKTDAFGDTIWSKTFGRDGYDRAFSVEETRDGGFVLVGESDGVMSATDVILIKTDANGDTMWTRLYGGTNYDEGYAVDQTLDGGYIVIGSTKSFGEGSYDVWLVKVNAFGDTIWTRTFGSVYTDIGFSGQQVSDSGFIVAGYTFSNGTGYSDALLMKTDCNGNMQWRKLYGNRHSDCFESVQQTPDGGYIAAGWTMPGTPNMAVYLVKTDSLGDTLWTRRYFKGFYDTGSSVDIIPDSGYIIVGRTMSSGGISDVYFVRTNSTGDTLWTKTVRRSPNQRNEGKSVQRTSDGGYIAVGYSDAYLYLIRLAPDTGIEEDDHVLRSMKYSSTIFRGPLVLPKDKICRVFDITGRIVAPSKVKPGIYFIEIDGQITRKVVKVR